ncbi:ABC transporter ATP-binding protein [Mediterraneibacter glycyrrhizinilyticus]|uniref:ABC transporter ATP-binding protein n=1 Tax=Mediterraneibacter glycyrrhizinilyticus TaxID=342942 RepID=UPI0025A3E00B|nr:ABC transporter ATP-binding protein [Mediterraneibacter glycyrrhizinilyticus]MDM8211494.1 ABC transporter ATP-binding protein [Mediterraneibacter glycyrrhizinilyticus]
MKNLFKYAAEHWKTLIVIIIVLFIQAYCDLSLPAYTSDIVNVGIQQGGVEDQVPESISVDEMNRLLLFVPSEDQDTVLDAYEEDDSTYDVEAYVMKKDISEEDISSLEEILAYPMMMTAGFESGSDMTAQIEEQMKASLPEGTAQEEMTVFDIMQMMPEEQREAMVDTMEEQMTDMPDTILDQAAVSYVGTVYEDLGINMDDLQIHYLLTTGGEMAGLAFLGMAASILVGFMASRVGAATGRDLRGRVFHKVVGFSNNEFDHFSTASLITRSTNDIQQIQLIIVMLLRIVLYAPILAIGGIIQVFQTNVSMSWIIGLAVVLIGLVILVLFLVAMPKFRIMQSLVDKVNLVMREILTGLSVIRAFSTQKYEEERFDKANRDLTRTNLFVNRAMTFMMPVMMLVMNGISVLIMWNGAHGIDNGEMQVGDMMAFIQYTMQIIMGFLMLCMLSIMLPRAAVAADRVQEVLDSRTVILDPDQPEKFSGNEKGLLTFDHVSFRYPGADENVIHDISFTARPGETTAIIGSTGSGKSTLVNLIPRFYDVTEGSITLDGVDIRNVSQYELRERLGYVPQKGVLFSGDIASNIMFGNPEGGEEEMVGAAEIAQATEFIDQKPEGYKSPIAQGGSNVSGGQKQRLSIARAIAKHPEVFIFDDSFSALDFKTDVTLRKALKKRTKNSTVLIVAQRISTILNAEQIIVLDDGKIAGMGTHQELLKTCEVYQQIAASQLSESELKAGQEKNDSRSSENSDGQQTADNGKEVPVHAWNARP